MKTPLYVAGFDGFDDNGTPLVIFNTVSKSYEAALEESKSRDKGGKVYLAYEIDAVRVLQIQL